VLESSFAENLIPRVHPHALYVVLNVDTHPPSPIWTKYTEYLSFSYTPYENISCNKFESEIEKPPPNAQQDFNNFSQEENVAISLQWLHLNDEKSQEQ
jgi:hypothetical protein